MGLDSTSLKRKLNINLIQEIIEPLAVQTGGPLLGFFSKEKDIIFWKQAAKILFLCLEAEQIFYDIINKTLPASKSRGEESPIIGARETPAKFLRV